MMNAINNVSKNIRNKVRNRMKGAQQDHDPDAPVQFSLFPEEREGRVVEKLKMKSILKSIYKSKQFAIDMN